MASLTPLALSGAGQNEGGSCAVVAVLAGDSERGQTVGAAGGGVGAGGE